MVEKYLLNLLLSRIHYGRLEVTYWDGSREFFGTDGPKLSVTIKTPRVVRRLAVNASLAVGEGYMDGDILITDLPLFFELVFKNRPKGRFAGLRQPRLRTPNNLRTQRHQIAHHYDVGNDYYRLFLDPTLTYSCARFVNGDDDLEKAQQQKIDYILNKARVTQPGQHLLDIGCGWGHLAVTAAKERGAFVTGITLSQEQLAGAKELAEREGVAHQVDFRLANYQNLAGEQYDCITGVGMYEHIGRGNQNRYFGALNNLLVDGGVSVLHTITAQDDHPVDAWVDKYIFPGGHLPTEAGIKTAMAKHGLWSIGTENMWHHYDRTLGRWRTEHTAQQAEIEAMFDPRFFRMRDYWLAGSQEGFRHGDLGLTQIVMTKGKPMDWPLTPAYMENSQAA